MVLGARNLRKILTKLICNLLWVSNIIIKFQIRSMRSELTIKFSNFSVNYSSKSLIFYYINPFSAKWFIIITTHRAPSFSGVAETRKKKFFMNSSSDKSFYVIEINLVSFSFFFFFFLQKAECFPRIMGISQKVSKM